MISIKVDDVNKYFDLYHATNDEIDIFRNRLKSSSIKYTIRPYDEQGKVIKVHPAVDRTIAYNIIMDNNTRED